MNFCLENYIYLGDHWRILEQNPEPNPNLLVADPDPYQNVPSNIGTYLRHFANSYFALLVIPIFAFLYQIPVVSSAPGSGFLPTTKKFNLFYKTSRVAFQWTGTSIKKI